MTPLHLMSDTDEDVCELLGAAKGNTPLDQKLLVSVIGKLVRDVKALEKQVKDLRADVGYMSA